MKKILMLLLSMSSIITYAQNVGVGTSSPAEKLDVNGNINVTGLIKLNNSTGVAGQVLVSNGLLAPTWQSVENPQIGFNVSSYSPSSISLPNSAETHVAFHYTGTPDFNDGNGFDNTSGNFICQSPGTYYFEAQIDWPDFDGPVILRIKKNGAIVVQYNDKIAFTSLAYGQSSRISCLIKCGVGDAISIYALQVSGSTQSINNGGATFFSGYKVY